MSHDGLIVVAGEALVDLVASDAISFDAHLGGGPYNAARTIGRLEQPVAFVGGLSTDRFGERLRGQLADDGVRVDTALATDEPTTLALAEVGDDGSATYRFYTAGTSAAGLTHDDLRDVRLAEIDTLLAGTLGLVLEPIGSTLEAMVRQLHDHTLMALDPNCRPSAVTDPGAYRSRLGRLLRRTDIVKASEEDLAWLYPGSTPVQGARALIAAGPPVAVVTRGSAGATVVTHDTAVDVEAPVVKVVDTIGAGDAFIGALLAALHRDRVQRSDLTDAEALLTATRFACAVAARTCERAGAVPPRLTEL